MLKLDFHRHANKTVIKADRSGDCVWIEGREGGMRATLFLDPDQADQIEAVLAQARFDRHAADEKHQERKEEDDDGKEKTHAPDTTGSGETPRGDPAGAAGAGTCRPAGSPGENPN